MLQAADRGEKLMLARLAIAVAATSLWLTLIVAGSQIALAQTKTPAAKPTAATGTATGTSARRSGRSKAAKPRGARLSDRIEQLSTKIDEALKAGADVPAALKSLQDLHNRVVALKQQLDQSQGVIRGFEEMRRKIDDYEERIGELELTLSAIRL